MKKFILLTAILALSFGAFSCGGGGAGSANLPPGENPGIPSVVQLTPSHFVAQTNSNITFHAKVLDGNGAPLKGVAVTFTNLSEPFGTLKGVLRKIGLMSPIATLSATVANTNDAGIATVNLFSSTAGFATIVSQVNIGVSNVRDKKTVLFISSDSFNLAPTVTLDVSKDGVNFNQPGDFTLFKTAGDNQRIIRATVRDRFGLRVSGASVSFSSDAASGVTFSPNPVTTNNNGEAFTLLTVSPTILTDITTVLNITATATLPNGTTASNVLSLFLSPVTVSPGPPSGLSSVTAVPTIVNVGGTSDVTATVFTNVGTPVPDGTTVNFTTAPKTASDPSPCGSITPFAQTTGGVTTPTATFTAPLVPGTCTITGKVGGVTIGTVDILVKEALSVQPGTQPVNGATGGTATYTIFGGVPGYTVVSSNPNVAFNGTPGTGTWNVASSGGTFVVTVPAGTPATNVTLTVRDQTGTTVAATLTIVVNGLKIVPTTLTVVSSASSQTAVFTISGGVTPYITTSSDPTKAFNASGTPSPGVWDGTTAGSTPNGTPITVTFPANVSAGAVTLNVFDAVGTTTAATITIIGSPGGPGGALNVTPAAVSVTGVVGTADNVTFTISGGVPPYVGTAFSNNAAIVPNATVTGTTFTIDPNPVAASTAVTMTVIDSVGTTKTATVTVTPQSSSLGVNPSTISVSGAVSILFHILGGTPPFQVFSSDTGIINVGGNPLITAADTFVGTTLGTAGSATVTIVDANNKTVIATVTVNLPTPNFTLVCVPAAVNSVTTSTCTLTSVNGYALADTLSCAPAAPTPLGSCAFVGNPVTPTPGGTNTILTYTCGGAGLANFDVVATDGSLTHSFPMTVTCP